MFSLIKPSIFILQSSLLISVIALFYYNPSTLLSYSKNILNANFQNIEEFTITNNYNKVKNSFEKTNPTILSTEELYSFIKTINPDSTIKYIEIDENTLDIYIDLTSQSDSPLWFNLEITNIDNSYNLTEMRFGLFSIPKFLYSYIASSIFQRTQEISNIDNPIYNTVISGIFGKNFVSAVDAKNIKFEKDRIIIDMKDSKTIYTYLEQMR